MHCREWKRGNSWKEEGSRKRGVKERAREKRAGGEGGKRRMEKGVRKKKENMTSNKCYVEIKIKSSSK